jgi:hypothetical protein
VPRFRASTVDGAGVAGAPTIAAAATGTRAAARTAVIRAEMFGFRFTANLTATAGADVSPGQ